MFISFHKETTMSKLFTRLAMLLVGLFIAGGLAFGATQAFASSSVMICDLQEEIGTCPGEFNQVSCAAECMVRYGNHGTCFGGCCVCLV